MWRAHQRSMALPFRDDALMDGPPSCTLEAFRKPLLRKCPFDLDSMSLRARIGGGLDGYVWKVRFGNKGPFALKIFFDTEPTISPWVHFPVQRECYNAALFQMIETSVAQATPESPIVVNADPAAREHAVANLYGFSEEFRPRLQKFFSDNSSIPTTTISKVPRLRQCYGWLSINADKLYGSSRSLWAPSYRVDKRDRYLEPGKDYLAIVYEYIEEGENDATTVEEVLNFLWLAGFCRTLSPLERNWTSSVLLDLSDFVPPHLSTWSDRLYGATTAENILRK